MIVICGLEKGKDDSSVDSGLNGDTNTEAAHTWDSASDSAVDTDSASGTDTALDTATAIETDSASGTDSAKDTATRIWAATVENCTAQ
ncbi:MAG: hypothetical protein JXX14_14540 [Deltaproteobacteria bacterium]|nr:hypothetical protein [Deltaproteobacteria bacterium]